MPLHQVFMNPALNENPRSTVHSQVGVICVVKPTLKSLQVAFPTLPCCTVDSSAGGGPAAFPFSQLSVLFFFDTEEPLVFPVKSHFMCHRERAVNRHVCAVPIYIPNRLHNLGR